MVSFGLGFGVFFFKWQNVAKVFVVSFLNLTFFWPKNDKKHYLKDLITSTYVSFFCSVLIFTRTTTRTFDISISKFKSLLLNTMTSDLQISIQYLQSLGPFADRKMHSGKCKYIIFQFFVWFLVYLQFFLIAKMLPTYLLCRFWAWFGLA